jgi:hypothetical protein
MYNICTWHSVFIQYNRFDVIFGRFSDVFAVKSPDVSGVFAKSETLARLLEVGWPLVAAMLVDQQADASGLFRSLGC